MTYKPFAGSIDNLSEVNAYLQQVQDLIDDIKAKHDC